jgi:DNA-binding transcriptional LysR family regulator
MQLEALKIFCDVVRSASFSRGAAENGISQSSASHVVHELEKRLGVKLIDRSKRPLVPTAHGRLYYEGCRELVARYFELENRVKALEDGNHVVGTVRVAAIYSVGLSHMSQYVERFHAEHPAADVRLEYLHPTQVIEAVRSGDAELGLISFPRKWTDLVAIPWREEEMVLAVHPEHPLAAQTDVLVGALDGARLIGFDPDLAIRRAIDRFLRQHGVQVETTLEFDNIENIKRAVELPGGAAILPAPTLVGEVKAGTIVAVPFRDARLIRPLAIIHRRNGEPGLSASRFLRLLAGTDSPATVPIKRMAVGEPS